MIINVLLPRPSRVATDGTVRQWEFANGHQTVLALQLSPTSGLKCSVSLNFNVSVNCYPVFGVVKYKQLSWQSIAVLSFMYQLCAISNARLYVFPFIRTSYQHFMTLWRSVIMYKMTDIY